MKILILCPHNLSRRMAGSNLRALEIARQLATKFDVTIGAPEIEDEQEDHPFAIVKVGRQSYSEKAIAKYDAVICNGTSLPGRAFTRTDGPLWIFDLYNPFLLEAIGSGRENFDKAWPRLKHLNYLYQYLLRRADLVLCASPQQRDFWLGGLHASGALHPGRMGDATAVEEFIRVVPFGIPDKLPARHGNGIRDAFPRIKPDDKILLWGGGIWNWLDPLTVINAMKILNAQRPDIKLVFMGANQKRDDYAGSSMADRARQVAIDAGLSDSTVFWGDRWIPYEERADYLLDSDAAICLAPEGMENTFSYRTRLTDAIWAGLPVVCTRGGFVADWVEEHQGGLTVSGKDAQAVAQAIHAVLEKDANDLYRRNLIEHRDQLRWNRCVEPLVNYLSRAKDGEVQKRDSRARAFADYVEYKTLSAFRRL